MWTDEWGGWMGHSAMPDRAQQNAMASPRTALRATAAIASPVPRRSPWLRRTPRSADTPSVPLRRPGEDVTPSEPRSRAGAPSRPKGRRDRARTESIPPEGRISSHPEHVRRKEPAYCIPLDETTALHTDPLDCTWSPSLCTPLSKPRPAAAQSEPWPVLPSASIARGDLSRMGLTNTGGLTRMPGGIVAPVAIGTQIEGGSGFSGLGVRPVPAGSLRRLGRPAPSSLPRGNGCWLVSGSPPAAVVRTRRGR